MLSAIRRHVLRSPRSTTLLQFRCFMVMSPDSRLGAESGGLHHEFDTDAGDHVPKEVSIHDRRQTQLSARQKQAAVLADFDGTERSAPFTSGERDPDAEDAALAAANPALETISLDNVDPLQGRDTVKQADEAVMQAENERD